MHHFFLVRFADKAASMTLTDAKVDCNHGVWNTITHTCDCDAGWTTDWLHQDVLGGNYVYCNSRASTPAPSNSSAATASFLAGKSTLIIIVVFAIVLIASCGVVAFCCYRKGRRLVEEKAKQSAILAAATEKEEARRQEEMQVQAGAAIQQMWAAQLELQRQNQAKMDQVMNMNTVPTTLNSQLSIPSSHHLRHRHEMISRQQGEATAACDADYEGGNSLADAFDRRSSQESFVLHPSYYRRGATPPTAGGYTNCPEIPLSYYTTTTTEAPWRAVKSPQYLQPTYRSSPF
ncbi:hypothetical protein NXY56_007963 [Leishmania guyanensis]